MRFVAFGKGAGVNKASDLTITPSLLKALKIIKQCGSVTPKQFANLYFDKSHDGWKRRTKCGNHGVVKGGGLVLWAGGYLGKLRHRELATYDLFNGETKLTKKGIDLLSETA